MSHPPTLFIALHDGFYGAGTGAGYSNYAFLQTVVDHLPPDVSLMVLPIDLRPTSPEYDPAWHRRSLDLLTSVNGRVQPIDNGTGAMTRFGDLTAFDTASRTAAATLADLTSPRQPWHAIAFDVPFLGMPTHLPRPLRRHLTLVPRSTALLHDPTNHRRITFEQQGTAAAIENDGTIGAISQSMRTHLIDQYHIPENKIIDIGDGLTTTDTHFTTPTDDELPHKARAGFILSMGRAQPYKGFHDLLDAIAILRCHRPVPHLILAAVTEDTEPNNYQRHLRQKIEHDIHDATLLTRFSPRIRNLLRHPALRAVIVPSRQEPFGRIPLEAYAAGAGPVVATTAGGLAEQVIDTVTGYTARPGNPTSLATGIQAALTTNNSATDQMRHAGKALLYRRFDYTTNTVAFLKAITPWSIFETSKTNTPSVTSSGHIPGTDHHHASSRGG